VKIPRADRMLDRLEQRILADTLRAAQHQGVVDLLGRPLHTVRQPAHDMCHIILSVDGFDVADPRIGLSRFAELEPGRPVQIEAGHLGAHDPAACHHQAIGDLHRQAGTPGHLFHRPVFIQP
jgi:hypothetical protein